MRDFFKPWRRKIGVVTLGLALGFMAGWVRSHVVSDHALVARPKPTFIRIDSRCGLFNCRIVQNKNVALPASIWRSNPVKVDDVDLTFAPPGYETDWHCKLFGIEIGEIHDPGGDVTVSCAIVPYFCFVVPLTLLSAYLLLSKPRTPAPKQTSEPASTTGT